MYICTSIYKAKSKSERLKEILSTLQSIKPWLKQHAKANILFYARALVERKDGINQFEKMNTKGDQQERKLIHNSTIIYKDQALDREQLTDRI